MERMAAFSARPVCYQVSVLLLLVCSCMFGIGMMLPWWAQTHLDGAVTSHSGLWLGCLSEASSPSSSSVGSSQSSSALLEASPAESSSSSVEKCSPIDAPGWFKAVQVMQCLALSGMGIACAYAVFANCCLDQVRYSRVIEVSSGLGGAVGIISGVVYLVKTSTALRHSRHIRYSWAFGLDIAACVLVLFVAAIVGLTNSQRRRYSSRRDYLRRMDNRLVVSDDEIVERRSRSTSRSRSRSLPSGSEVRGLMVEMERSPARTRRLDGISRDSSSCGAVVASTEALVMLQNRDGTRSATTATILQRPTSGFLDPHPQLMCPQRPRSACDESHIYQNPFDLLSYHHPSIASVCSRTAQALGTGSSCSCSHTSVSYLSEPQTVPVSRRSSCISIPKSSCTSLHCQMAHQPCRLSTGKLVHACSWCHERNAHEIAGLGRVCTCCADSHQGDCKAVDKKSDSCVHLESSRAPKNDCICSESEDVGDCQAHKLSCHKQSKGCYMAVPTEADDEHLSLKKAHHCDCSEIKPAKVPSVLTCPNYQPRSPCLHLNTCRTDHKPVCAVHGHMSASCTDSDKENEDVSLQKMPLIANTSLHIHQPRPTASAPPLETEYVPEQAA